MCIKLQKKEKISKGGVHNGQKFKTKIEGVNKQGRVLHWFISLSLCNCYSWNFFL